ncbi:hypothetical protein KEF29_29590 [Streptomyces tuirus]|uniref:Uncharacterized protein n=1 Tax=Streptomyces tuirus TaxID=68278 RepID=A0A941J0R7_9ACTN|nr:hypothetical protein [Streptomyces tuirus]
MLLVDHEEPTAAEDVAVDSAEGSVVDDTHGSGELVVQPGEGAYGDRGLVLVFAAGDVLDGEDDALPVAVVAGGGEEPLGAADDGLLVLAVLVVQAGGGVDAAGRISPVVVSTGPALDGALGTVASPARS